MAWPSHFDPLALDAGAEDAPVQTRRHEPRIPAGSVLPVQVRRSSADGQSEAWTVADILDLSCDGMALLLPAAAAQDLDGSLLLDVSPHPAFGCTRLTANTRWQQPVNAFGVYVMVGLQFDRRLAVLPALVQSRK
jgi:hypothetical protein